jgi:PadR family transcriptional regulator PadR
VRQTYSLVRVALALMEDPSGRFWGYDLRKQTGLRSGVLYPILHRMLAEEWLTDGWEGDEAKDAKRPARRYYELTEEGVRQLGGVLQSARRDARFTLRPGLA